MISFVEYACEILMGPPLRRRAWVCPFHNDHNPSFTVNPPKRRPDGGWYPIKFKCFGCDRYGDAMDLIQHFYPDDSRQQHGARWSTLAAEYTELTGQPVTPSAFISSGRRGQNVEAVQFCLSELKSAVRDRGLEWNREDAGLYVMLWASHIAQENGVALEDFARHCISELVQVRAAKC